MFRDGDSVGTSLGLRGRSSVMRRIFDRIARVAALSTNVLLAGESGTGKELAARAIHLASPRRCGPFVPVNCAALPRDLIESELFGHRRGAFSGAVSDHPGLFRAADGGTLFLDEITEMAADVQAKLLRALQERAVRPVGSISSVPVDVRIIASSNRDLGAAVSNGRLRQDLYYRLCVHTILLPPLRERREDIQLLVQHHVEGMNRGGTFSIQGVTREAMEWLARQPWPGNVRELFKVIDSAVALSDSSHLDVEALTASAFPSGAHPASLSSPATSLLYGRDGAVPTLRDGEAMLIRRALEVSNGNKLLAARLLGVSRKTLYKKLGKLGLSQAKPEPARDQFRLVTSGSGR